MSKSGWEKAVDEAVRRLGSRNAVAKRLGITSQAIAQWHPKRGPKVEHVPALEEMSGVPRYEIRPDIYERPPEPSRAKARTVGGRASQAA